MNIQQKSSKKNERLFEIEFYNLAFFFILLIISNPLRVQSQSSQKLITIEGISEYRLNNGLRILLYPDLSKSTITVNLVYKVGSRHEGYGEKGMAHLLEHMLFKGSKNHKNIPGEMAAHGCINNASTSYDFTNYFETFNPTTENIKWALELESDRMIHSFINEQDLKKEFSVVRNEFERSENFPYSVLSERVMSTAFLWHNYGDAVIGSKSDIEGVKAISLKAFYKKYYQPDNATLIVSGNFKESEILNFINLYFGKIPAPTRVLNETYTTEPTQDGERSVVLRRSGDIQIVSRGYHIPSAIHPDFLALEIAGSIMTDKPDGRLYKGVVDTKAGTACYVSIEKMKDPGFIYFEVEAPKDKSIETLQVTVDNVFNSLQANPITNEEVKRAVERYKVSLNQYIKSSEMMTFWLTEYIGLGDWKLLFVLRDQLDSITSNDVNRVISNYWKKSNCTYGIFYPEGNADRSIIPVAPFSESLTKNYKGRSVKTITNVFDTAPEAIQSNLVSGELSSGMKYSLLEKPSPAETVTIQMIMRIGNEKALENKHQLTEMTANMLTKGTKSLSYSAIKDSLDRLQARLMIFGGRQEVTVYLTTNRSNVCQSISLLNDILRNPIFPTNEFENYKNEKIASLLEVGNEPQFLVYSTSNSINNVYSKIDFRYPLNKEERLEQLNKIQSNDLKNFHKEFFNYANTSFGLVGDFDKDSILLTMNEIFTSWNSPIQYEKTLPIPQNIKIEKKSINTPDKENAVLLFTKGINLNENHPDYPSLFMANYIFGGSQMNSRLSKKIRQMEGLSYSVGSYLIIGAVEPQSTMIINASYNPSVNKAITRLIIEVVDSLNQFGITETELSEAKSGIMQKSIIERGQDYYLSYKLAFHPIISRDFKWYIDFEKSLDKLSVQEVNLAIKKYINSHEFCEVSAGDFK